MKLIRKIIIFSLFLSIASTVYANEKILNIVESKFGLDTVESISVNRPDNPLVLTGSLIINALPISKSVNEVFIKLNNGILLNCYVSNLSDKLKLTRCQVTDTMEDDSISFDGRGQWEL